MVPGGRGPGQTPAERARRQDRFSSTHGGLIPILGPSRTPAPRPRTMVKAPPKKKRRIDLRKTLFVLPNMITLSSIFCGFLSIRESSKALNPHS